MLPTTATRMDYEVNSPMGGKELEMGKTYEATVKIRLLADHASVEDFGRELDQFNQANKGEIEVEMGEAKQIIEVVQVSVRVGIPKSQIRQFRDNSEDGLADITDEQIVDGLAEDILDRYFNTEYFDLDTLLI